MVTRRAAVPSLAKVNLSLKVLGRRADGYHELRTVFQTIGLADRIWFEFTPARRGLEIALEDPLGIPENLVLRAARLFCETLGVRGRLRMRLEKRIPAGAGLGGGSSNAAAVLLTLGPLTGRDADPGSFTRWRPRSAATCRSSFMAARPWAWAVARSSIPCRRRRRGRCSC